MSREQAHDHAPDCPDCETDLYVARREGNQGAWKCWRCGGWWHDDDADDQAGRLVADGCGHVLIRPSSTRSDHIYHHPHSDYPEKPRCKVERGGTEAREYRRRDPATLGDHYRLCSYCDPEWSVERETDDMAAYRLLADADSLDDLRADGGEVTIENPELFDQTIRNLRGFADNLEDVDGLQVSAGVIRDWARDLEAATRREVDDGE